MTFVNLIAPFLIYWFVLFVACYIVVEFAQNYLYDETTPGVGLRVALGSLLLAAMLTWTRSTFDTMFTTDLGQTVIQAVLWFAVFTLVYRFQPVHGAAIGIATMLLISGLASLGVDSLTNPARRRSAEVRSPEPVPRRSTSPVPTPAPVVDEASSEESP